MEQDKEFALKVAVVSTVVYMIMIKVIPGLLQKQTGTLGEVRDFLQGCEKIHVCRRNYRFGLDNDRNIGCAQQHRRRDVISA